MDGKVGDKVARRVTACEMGQERPSKPINVNFVNTSTALTCENPISCGTIPCTSVCVYIYIYIYICHVVSEELTAFIFRVATLRKLSDYPKN